MKCPTCGMENRIVNECRCDPNNLPTLLPPVMHPDDEARPTTPPPSPTAFTEYMNKPLFVNGQKILIEAIFYQHDMDEDGRAIVQIYDKEIGYAMMGVPASSIHPFKE